MKASCKLGSSLIPCVPTRQLLKCAKPVVTGVNVLAPSQNENPGNPHFDDQRDLAGWRFFKPMLTEREDIEKSKQPQNRGGTAARIRRRNAMRERAYYALWFRLDDRDAYLLWYSNDLDGVVVDERGDIPNFPV